MCHKFRKISVRSIVEIIVEMSIVEMGFINDKIHQKNLQKISKKYAECKKVFLKKGTILIFVHNPLEMFTVVQKV